MSFAAPAGFNPMRLHDSNDSTGERGASFRDSEANLLGIGQPVR